MKSNVDVYRYSVYGLKVESSLELEELIEVVSPREGGFEADVKIRFGDLSYVKERFKETIVASENRDNMYVIVNNIGVYQVKNGNEIIVDPYEEVSYKRIKSYLLGWAFGVLFTQRNVVALHGSALVNNGKGIIISGRSKAGKSTLAAALKLKGYDFTSDDVSTISFDESSLPQINPAYPQQKLCEDAMEKLGYNTKDFVRSSQNEYRIRYAVPDNERFVNKTIPIENICEISIGDNNGVEIEEVRGGEKIQFLIDNGYFVNVEQKMGMRQKYFKQYLDIARNVNMYRMKRPKDKFSVEEQILVLERTIRDKNLKEKVI